MGSNVMTREDDERALEILDLWDSRELTNAEIRARYGMSNSAVQGLVTRCLREPDKLLPCLCKKPENMDGAMGRGWWRP